MQDINKDYRLEIKFDYHLANDNNVSSARINKWLNDVLSASFITADGINWYVKAIDPQPYETLLGVVVILFTDSNVIPRYAKICKIYNYLDHKFEDAMNTFKLQVKASRV